MPFKYYRKRAGLTQMQVAKELGVDRTTVSKWDIMVNLPRAELLPKIALLYGCGVADLLEPCNPIIQGNEVAQNV
jgi:transcriptional regulator with XRE-family HTH domain